MLRPHETARAGPVVDDLLPAAAVGKLLDERAHDDIDISARREWHEAYRLGRVNGSLRMHTPKDPVPPSPPPTRCRISYVCAAIRAETIMPLTDVL